MVNFDGRRITSERVKEDGGKQWYWKKNRKGWVGAIIFDLEILVRIFGNVGSIISTPDTN